MVRPAGRVRRCSKTPGSGRVGLGQDVMEIAWVRSGRARRVSSFTGRVKSQRSDPIREKPSEYFFQVIRAQTQVSNWNSVNSLFLD